MAGDAGDLLGRLEETLRAHPGWYVRFDGMKDLFVAGRNGGAAELAAYRLPGLLDELDKIPPE